MSLLFPLSDWSAFVVGLLGFGGLVGMGELLRRFGASPSTSRRFVHAGVCGFVVVAPWLFATPRPLYGLAILFLVVNAVARGRDWWPALHAARPRSWGTVALPLALVPALAATWSVSPDRVYILQMAFLVLGVADPAASGVGQARAEEREGVEATALGSCVFAVISVLVTLLFALGLGWSLSQATAVALLVAPIGTMVEAISPRGWDNLFVVLAVILLLVPLHEGEIPRGTLGGALGVGLVFGAAAYELRTLDGPAAIAGGLFAASLVGLGGWTWALPGFVFFILSSALSLVGQRASAGKETGEDAQRSRTQVMANGGLAWGLLGAWVVLPPGLERLRLACYVAFLGALAAAAADTWATEVGRLSRTRPRSLRTLQRVPHGTSGAVSVVGTVAALLGATSVVAAAFLVGGFPVDNPRLVGLVVLAAGVLGMGIDSLLGATLQAQYRGSSRAGLTEQPPDDDQSPVRGFAFVDNDVVNLFGTATGAITAVIGFLLGGL